MQGYERDNLRRKLDEALLPFRLARRRMVDGQGWVKNIRQAVGIPVDELARRMGVCRWEIHRLEESEANSRIMLATLKRAANGLGCVLVYALVPKEGTLEDLAADQRSVREDQQLRRDQEREIRKKPWLEAIGFRERFLLYIRTRLRKEGYRVRPRKTERGVAKREEEFEETMRLARLAEAAGRLGLGLEEQQANPGKP